jgi:polo-like kinase 1
MTTKTTSKDQKEIPDLIKDTRQGTTYVKGRFLGKGGFARCYELKKLSDGDISAGKIVPKALLTKPHQREKMAQEITLHKVLKHPYIVKLFDYFEDKDFVYIVLELCRRRSLMELHKRRKAITEPETRYFMKQITLGVKYLHDKKIIHRDLKLGNIFLNDHMEIKLGDFGLATKVDYDGERKRTLCGTPNYIAPEVLTKKDP